MSNSRYADKVRIDGWYRLADGRQFQVVRSVEIAGSPFYKVRMEFDAGSGFPEKLREWASGKGAHDVALLIRDPKTGSHFKLMSIGEDTILQSTFVAQGVAL